jgi:hypothetical protein
MLSRRDFLKIAGTTESIAAIRKTHGKLSLCGQTA